MSKHCNLQKQHRYGPHNPGHSRLTAVQPIVLISSEIDLPTYSSIYEQVSKDSFGQTTTPNPTSLAKYCELVQ